MNGTLTSLKSNTTPKIYAKMNAVTQPYLPRNLSYAMPQDSFTRTNQTPTQKREEEYYQNSEIINETSPSSLVKNLDELETARILKLSKTKITSLPNLKNVRELWAPRTLKYLNNLQTAKIINIYNTKITSLPSLTEVKREFFGPRTLKQMDKLETAGFLHINQTQIESLPSLREVNGLWAPWTLGEDILKVGCPKLTNVKSILILNKSSLACKDFPSLIQIGDDDKLFQFQGNQYIKTMGNLLKIINKNRQEKDLLPLEAQHIERDQYIIIYPEENPKYNKRTDMLSERPNLLNMQKSNYYSQMNSRVNDYSFDKQNPTYNERTDMLLNRPNLLNMQKSNYYSQINPRVNDYSFDTINPTYNERTDMLSNRPNLLNTQELDYNLGINNPFSRTFEYNNQNQNKNINYFG